MWTFFGTRCSEQNVSFFCLDAGIKAGVCNQSCLAFVRSVQLSALPRSPMIAVPLTGLSSHSAAPALQRCVDSTHKIPRSAFTSASSKSASRAIVADKSQKLNGPGVGSMTPVGSATGHLSPDTCTSHHSKTGVANVSAYRPLSAFKHKKSMTGSCQYAAATTSPNRKL